MPRWLPLRSRLERISVKSGAVERGAFRLKTEIVDLGGSNGGRAFTSPGLDFSSAELPRIEGIGQDLPTGPGGIHVFESDDAARINQARMEHLGSLGLPLEGRSVLDAGAGVGKLARFFVGRGCRVVCVDGRRENIAVLTKRYSDMDGVVGNIETDSLAMLAGEAFDVVFAYGIVYHLESPIAGLRNLASVCKDLMVIETAVCDSARPVTLLVDESATTWNQALTTLAMRPSPAWMAMALSRLGFYAYTPATIPNHEDYQVEWRNNGEGSRDGHLIRCVFVGSRRRLKNPALRLLLEPNMAVAETSGS